MLKIKTIRQAQGISQVKLAAASKITPAYLCELELGVKTNPGLDILNRIAEALNVTVAELLDNGS